MSFSVLSKSPHLPDSVGAAIALLFVLAAIGVLTLLLANVRIAAPLTLVGLIGFLFDRHFYIPGAMVLALLATLLARTWRGEPLRQAGKFGASIRDVVAIAAGFLLYEFGRTFTECDKATAVSNAEHLIRLERFLDFPQEARVQQLVFDHSWLVTPFNTVYSFFFLAITVGGLIWLSFNAPDVYRTTRNAMGVATFSALAVFALLPMAPPRMVELSGLADSHARVGLTHGYVNEFAAMPSLHVGWMALIGWALARAIGGNHGKLIGLIPPVGMMLTVVVTGHHYWMDGIIGSTLCVVPAVLLDRGATSKRLALPVPTPAPNTVAIAHLITNDERRVSSAAEPRELALLSRHTPSETRSVAD
jgi:hypothetical protein